MFFRHEYALVHFHYPNASKRLAAVIAIGAESSAVASYQVARMAQSFFI